MMMNITLMNNMNFLGNEVIFKVHLSINQKHPYLKS